MRILITGHRGYIGERLLPVLASQGHKIIGLDIKDGYDILSADLPDDHDPVDVVYHLAAQSGAPASMRDPVWDARNNILGTIRLAKHFQRRPVRVIFTTSGGAKDPESAYGLSKKTAEEYLKLFIAPANLLICRLSSIYGGKPRGVVDTFIRADKPIIYGDGTAVRDFVHVDDIVSGLAMALNWEPGEYDMGSGQGTTIQQIAEATGKEYKHGMARCGEKQYAVLENTTPDWSPTLNVIEYVRARC